MGPSDPDRKLTVEMPISVPIYQMVSNMKVGVHIVALEGLNIIKSFIKKYKFFTFTNVMYLKGKLTKNL